MSSYQGTVCIDCSQFSSTFLVQHCRYSGNGYILPPWKTAILKELVLGFNSISRVYSCMVCLIPV